MADLILVRRMIAQIASPTPLPEQPHFPVDFIDMLRISWPILAVYYVIAIPAVILAWRALKVARYLHSAKCRLLAAAVLAAAFTPGEVSDFFLFSVPGPAIAGLVLLFLAAASVGSPAILLLGLLIYVLPLSLVFGVFYAALTL